MSRLPPGGSSASSLLRRLMQDTHCKTCGATLAAGERYLCAKCAAESQRLNREAEERLAAHDRAERQRVLESRLAMVPLDFRGVDFAAAADRVTRAGAVAETCGVTPSTPMVSFTGESGSGKTTLAAAMFNAVLRSAIDGGADRIGLAESAMWTSAVALAMDRRQHPMGAGESPLVAMARASSYLVIDDVGLEQHNFDAIAEVIYERQSNQRPTVLTLSLPADDLAARYGGGIVRRIGGARAVVIRCDHTPQVD